MVVVPAALDAFVDERTPTVHFGRPAAWQRGDDRPSLTIGGGEITMEVRSRPSDSSIADESLALLGRLPGAGDGVVVVGCDPWTGAGAPARLVEYARVGPSAGEGVFIAHLVVADGRHRTDVIVERPLLTLEATDPTVFAILDSVRAIAHVRGADRVRESLPALAPLPFPDGIHLDADAFAALRGLAGSRWSPTALRSWAGRALVDAGLISRFGAVPPTTTALLATLTAEPIVVEQERSGGPVTRLQAFVTPPSARPEVRSHDSGERSIGATLVDGDATTGYRIVAASIAGTIAALSGRLGIRPTWTWRFRTARLPEGLVEARCAGDASAAALPDEARDDEALVRFWEAPWTVSTLRPTGGRRVVRILRAHGVGFARLGRPMNGSVAIRAEASANVFRTVIGAVSTAEAD